MEARIQEAAQFILANASPCLDNTGRLAIGMITGSGSQELFSGMPVLYECPYQEIPGFPLVSGAVAGHASLFRLVQLDERSVVAVMLGRVHWYQGVGAEELGFQVRLLHRLGIRHLILANASGSLAPPNGTVVVLRDHLSFAALSGFNPLIGIQESANRIAFPNPKYHPRSLEFVREAAKEAGIPAKIVISGIYGHNAGPSYETRSELRLMHLAGCTVVGMSTVPEVITASALGLSVIAVALVTNQCPLEDTLQVTPLNVRTSIHSAMQSISFHSLTLLYFCS